MSRVLPYMTSTKCCISYPSLLNLPATSVYCFTCVRTEPFLHKLGILIELHPISFDVIYGGPYDDDVLTASSRAVAADADVSLSDHSTNLKEGNNFTFPIVYIELPTSSSTKAIM